MAEGTNYSQVNSKNIVFCSPGIFKHNFKMLPRSFSGVLLLFLLLFFASCSFPDSSVERRMIEVGGQKLEAEIPRTARQKEKGLGGREYLSEKKGMLFIYEEAERRPFWMKDMRISLDFIWIRDGRVVEISDNIHPREAQPPDTLTPKEKADMVLEVKAGTTDKYGIEVGDRVEVNP